MFQDKLYGAVVSAAPELTPSTWNCTLAIPTVDAAVALTVTVPDTVAPPAGALIDTVGGEFAANVVNVKS